MNHQLSFQSSLICDDAGTSKSTPASSCKALAQRTAGKAQEIGMTTQKVVNKKLMLLMAMCLVFATAVPVMVLAAS